MRKKKEKTQQVQEVQQEQIVQNPIESLNEKQREQLCISEIQMILTKYNCRLEASITISEHKTVPSITVITNAKLGG